MKRLKTKTLVLSLLMAASTNTPVSAAVITVDFSGNLTSAANFDENGQATADGFFKVGQSFTGSFSYDNAVSGSSSDPSTGYFFDLDSFNVIIGGKDLSSRFIPRHIFRQPNGDVQFLSGGASQAGSTSISLNLLSPYTSYPASAELNNKTALFKFEDFTPFGGSVSGSAVLSAIGSAAVPESSTWAMMVAGIGGIGFALRRRRAAPIKAAGLA